jgi:hypothetical protein
MTRLEAGLPHAQTPPTIWPLWLPLLDGAERLGVLGLTLPSIDDPVRKRCSWLATLVAEMILSKGQCTDGYSLARRRQPMSPAAEMQWQMLPPLTLASGRDRWAAGTSL